MAQATGRLFAAGIAAIFLVLPLAGCEDDDVVVPAPPTATVTVIPATATEPPVPTATPDPGVAACLGSGGQVDTASCCLTTGDFPDTCAVGACGCAPASSHEVRVCECGAGNCFDGSACVPVVEPTAAPTATPPPEATATPGEDNACTQSGGTVFSGLCCIGAGDFPDTCAIGACGCDPQDSEEVQLCDCGAGSCFDGSACVPDVQ